MLLMLNSGLTPCTNKGTNQAFRKFAPAFRPGWRAVLIPGNGMSFYNLEFVRADDGTVTANSVGTEGTDTIIGTPGLVEVTEDQAVDLVREMFKRAAKDTEMARLELAKMVLREILKHPDFYPPKALPHNPSIGEICPQCGQNDSHMPECLIGAALDVLNDAVDVRLPERVGPVRGER